MIKPAQAPNKPITVLDKISKRNGAGSRTPVHKDFSSFLKPQKPSKAWLLGGLATENTVDVT